MRVQYDNLPHFEYRNPTLKKKEVAALLGVRPDRYTRLRDLRYRTKPTDAEVSALASLLRRSESYVRRLYESADVSCVKGKGRHA